MDKKKEPINFVKNFDLPILITEDADYLENLEIKLREYQHQIETIFKDNHEIKQNVNKNVESILNAIRYVYNANFIEAYKSIFSILDKYANHKMIVTTLDNSPAIRGVSRLRKGLQEKTGYSTDYRDKLAAVAPTFFRARTRKNLEIFTKKDLLHIPFNRRSIVSSQRFSIPGLPCMYFGTTSQVCLTELDNPLEEDVYLSSYKIDAEKKILNLAITQDLINILIVDKRILKEEEAQDLFEIFPLVIATSFKVSFEDPNKDMRSFKSDYIISQLIMQCLDSLNIDGLAYISKKSGQDTDAQLKTNFAFPIFSKPNETNYGTFTKEISMTEPITLKDLLKNNKNKYLKSKQEEIFSELWGRHVNKENHVKEYPQIDFKIIDKLLIDQNHQKTYID